jgi:hypothetical protein
VQRRFETETVLAVEQAGDQQPPEPAELTHGRGGEDASTYEP